MICSLVRWLVSQSLDSGKPLPQFAASHAGRCRSCGRFLAVSKGLDARLVRDGVEMTRVPQFAVERETQEAAGAWSYSMRFAAAAACVLVFGGLFAGYSLQNTINYSQGFGRPGLPEGGMDLLSMSGLSMETIGGNPESRLSREIVYLAQDASSAAKFISEPLAFGIPEIN